MAQCIHEINRSLEKAAFSTCVSPFVAKPSEAMIETQGNEPIPYLSSPSLMPLRLLPRSKQRGDERSDRKAEHNAPKLRHFCD